VAKGRWEERNKILTILHYEAGKRGGVTVMTRAPGKAKNFLEFRQGD